MAKLHIFIDGSWLIKVCAPSGILAQKLLIPDQFRLDFNKLKSTIFNHISTSQPDCTEIGDCYFITSIFDIPADVNTWVGNIVNSRPITQAQLDTTTRNVNMRQNYASRAIAAGFNTSGIIRVTLKDWIVRKLSDKKYQEKQVDTTVVALLVKYAITKSNDYFAIVAGDSDILPAIDIAYPEFTQKICWIANHPDQLDAAHRQTSFSFFQYKYAIPPLFLHDRVDSITEGRYIYTCPNCHKVFISPAPFPQNNQTFCSVCSRQRS